MNLDPIITIVATLILSVLANLATPWVKRQIAARMNAQAADSEARRERRYKQARYFIEHPEVFTQFLVRSMIAIVWYSLALILFLLAAVGITIIRLLAPAQVASLPIPVPGGIFMSILILATAAVLIATILHRMFVVAVLYFIVRRERIKSGDWPEDWRL